MHHNVAFGLIQKSIAIQTLVHIKTRGLNGAI